MSRTKKDRPYWVKQNQDGTLTDHDHLLCGQESYKRVYVRDIYGAIIYNRHVQKYIYFNEAKAMRLNITYEQAWAGYAKNAALWEYSSAMSLDEMRIKNPSYGYLWQEREVDRGTYAEYTMELSFVYPDECTAGQKLRKGNHRFREIQLPCTPMLPNERRFSFYSISPRKDDRKYYNSKIRNNARAVLLDYSKSYNSGEGIDDVENITQQHRHGISWWC